MANSENHTEQTTVASRSTYFALYKKEFNTAKVIPAV